MPQSFLSQLDWRFATKKFDTTKKVSETDLEKILEAIRKAPSPFGLQPYHMYIVTNPQMREKMRAVSYGQPQVTESSAIIVFCARTDLKNRVEEYVATAHSGTDALDSGLRSYADQSIHPSVDNFTPEQALAWSAKQAYIALGFGLAACAELGIDACPMEGFEREKIDEVLGLPSHVKSQAYMTIGYRLEGPTRPKVRFSEEDIFTKIQ